MKSALQGILTIHTHTSLGKRIHRPKYGLNSLLGFSIAKSDGLL